VLEFVVMLSNPIFSRFEAAILALMSLVFISGLVLVAHAIFYLAEIAGRRYRKRAATTPEEDRAVEAPAKQRKS